MTAPRYFALIPAAGIGARMGGECPKQYMPIAGKPMLRHVIDTFCTSPAIQHTFIVVSAEDAYIRDLMPGGASASVFYNGGATRYESVLNGLHAMRAQVDDDDWVLVHDAARPGLTVGLIGKLIQLLRDDAVGGLLALPVVDTIKRADTENRAEATVSRDRLWAAQTPQMFRYGLLCRALEHATQVTDESSAIEALGMQPKLVEGSPRNFKVTLPQDIALAEIYLTGIA